MSRAALVDPLWQAGDDKTRVSSIYKRRVTPVPEEVAASTEIETSGPKRSWMAPFEVWTRRSQFGLRDLALFLLAEGSSAPCAQRGSVSWLSSARLDCHPVAPSSRVRWSADPLLGPPFRTERGPSQSRSRRPASQRTSPGSEPSVEKICRLITGRDRAPRVHRAVLDPGSPRPLTSCFASPGTLLDDAIPVDPAASSWRSRAAPR